MSAVSALPILLTPDEAADIYAALRTMANVMDEHEASWSADADRLRSLAGRMWALHNSHRRADQQVSS